MEDYEKECAKRKVRAEKFGTTYIAPKLEDFLPWTEVKRLRTQSKKGEKEQGFATGIDLMDSEEIAKQEARRARFSKLSTDEEREDETKETSAQSTEAGEPATKEAASASEKKAEDLPVAECWDKLEMLGPQRGDPPPSLWIHLPREGEEKAEERQEETTSDGTTWVPEKIHLFSIDWAAFKQIRNKDLMAFFTGYGPTYVEWLGDLSCNVCFGDQFTAKRALMTLGQEIPSPPPEVIMHAVEGENEESSRRQCFPDFGNMTWRFCRQPIRKIANDKHGRKGTTARVLMRLASSNDILQERPNSWPAPPGGFSSTKLLGPDSDYSKKERSKRDRKRRQREAKSKNAVDQDTYIQHTDKDSDHPMLGRGLSAGRNRFSVADLEQERAKKRAKKTNNDPS